MFVIDFEVFKEDWLCVAIDLNTKEEIVIVNDRERFVKFYEENKTDLFIGYNIREYDSFIMKAILCDFNPKDVNDFIIVQKNKGYQYSRMFQKIKLNTFDIMPNPPVGLKTLEGFMGSDIRETSVDFTIDRKLTQTELDEVIQYCRHDVYQTCMVWAARNEEFTSQLGLIQMFQLPISDMGRTKAQLSAKILNATRVKGREDAFEFCVPKNLKIKKYQFVIDWFLKVQDQARGYAETWGIEPALDEMYEQQLECVIAGVPHTIAWGGLHGAIPKYFNDGYFINVDVASYYPSMMIECNYHSRNIHDPQKFVDIYNNRLAFKKAKDKRQQPLKIVLNSTYGAMKDQFNALYDPLMANNVCVTGQLFLIDLIEHLEPYCDIVQSNTDGILVRLRATTEDEADREYARVDDICHEWEQRTKMVLEFEEFSKVVQKDVNNYLVVPRGELYDEKGKPRWKSKGAYVKKLNDLDYDLPIVNKAVVDYFIKGIPVEKTIRGAIDLREFQKIVKISNLYLHGIKNATFHFEMQEVVNKKGKLVKKKVKVWNRDGEKLTDKTFRVFASTREGDGGIYKLKDLKKNPEKFANTADHCFIDNSEVKGKALPKHLDVQWYIDLANKRIKEFLGA